MGLMSALSGNAGPVPPQQAQESLAPMLLQGEQVQRAYHVGRDLFAFTDRRLILVDKQGMTGSKVELHSIQYRSVTHFAIETAGSFDMDAELKIWITGNPLPISREFNKKVNVYEVQAVLGHYVLR